jgi:hypothetical protein
MMRNRRARGTGFSGTTAVLFNGKASTFSVISATEIQATVPAGATTRKITVRTPTGRTPSEANFTVL